MPQGPFIQVHVGRLAWGESVLFDRLDFTLPQGAWTCLLGASGVGKTTVLRLIAGLETAEDFTIAPDRAALAPSLAWMGQSDLLLPWLDALDNVLIGARLRGEAVTEAMHAKARTLLAEVGLAALAHAHPARLSGGERQRVALARTLMEDRPVVLMDEPFSALDALTRLEMQDLAARLLAGRTVLLVTHDPREALRLGDQILVLAGRPARLQAAVMPAGARPRALDQPDLIAQETTILRHLAGGEP